MIDSFTCLMFAGGGFASGLILGLIVLNNFKKAVVKEVSKLHD